MGQSNVSGTNSVRQYGSTVYVETSNLRCDMASYEVIVRPYKVSALKFSHFAGQRNQADSAKFWKSTFIERCACRSVSQYAALSSLYAP